MITRVATPEIKRDRYGRYILPHPKTGKEQPWTRATTWAKTISDTYALEAWKRRMVAKGIATRPDLYMLAAATSLDDRNKLDEIADDALEYAGASRSANLGTALHSFTEQLDRGEEIETPDPWSRDLKAYQERLAKEGLKIDPSYIERVVICSPLVVAGTLDRIGTIDGQAYITDVKTGADLSYAWNEISIQLAIYANADAMWDGGGCEPMPTVDKRRAVVVHLPAGAARCDLYWVDVSAGWKAAQLASDVRGWRKRRDLATSFEVAS